MKANHSTDKQNLEALLHAASPEEQADVHMVWDLTGMAGEPGDVDRAEEERVWQALETLIHAEEALPERPRLRRVAWRHRGWMAVAATLLLGAVGLALWRAPITRMAPPMERVTVELPDGSQVELNSGSALRYARRFGSVRAVHLEGEAFFDVATDGRPFRVETFNAQVEVLGTRFNVKARSNGLAPATTVTLESGQVALAALDRANQVIAMVPGETRTMGPNATLSRRDTLAIHRAFAWRTGALIYQDEWLGVVLEDLERQFDVDLVLKVPSLQRKRINFSSHNPTDVEAVISGLCAGNDLNYRPTATGFELYDPDLN